MVDAINWTVSSSDHKRKKATFRQNLCILHVPYCVLCTIFDWIAFLLTKKRREGVLTRLILECLVGGTENKV